MKSILIKDKVQLMTDMLMEFERAAQRNPGPSGPGQASYLSICGKELATPYRSGESPSLQEGVLQSLDATDVKEIMLGY